MVEPLARISAVAAARGDPGACGRGRAADLGVVSSPTSIEIAELEQGYQAAYEQWLADKHASGEGSGEPETFRDGWLVGIATAKAHEAA